jgi:hypothetical protein
MKERMARSAHNVKRKCATAVNNVPSKCLIKEHIRLHEVKLAILLHRMPVKSEIRT